MSRESDTGPGPTARRESREVLWVVATGTLLAALAGSTVTLALPALAVDFDLGVEQVGWVLQGYLLSATVFLLVAGRLGDMFGHRRIYLAGFSLFALMSLACGLAWELSGLVAARGIQGLGSALVMAVSPAILTTTRSSASRGRALGLTSTATYLGLTAGPALGGLVVGLFSWRAVFIVPVPLALGVLALGFRNLPRTAPVSGAGFDLPGLALLMVGLPSLLLAVTMGNGWGWSSGATLGALAVGLGGLALFVAVEMRQREPLLEVSMFRSPVFTGASFSAICNYVALFIPTILLPFYLTRSLGLAPGEAGLLLTVQPAIMAVSSLPAGVLSDRVGTRWPCVLGMLTLAGGVGWLSTVDAQTSSTTLAGALAIMGLGVGVFISPNSSALMGAAPRHLQGAAGGILAISRTLGMMLGVAAAGALFSGLGGAAGGGWGQAEFDAMGLAMLVASGVAVLGALASAVRSGGRQTAPPVPTP